MNDVLTPTPVPATDEIDLWWLPPPEHRLDLRFPAALSPAELARAARFQVEPARQSFVHYRTAMRVLLAKYAGVSPRELPLGVGEFGKPLWCHPLQGVQLEFNLSHTSHGGLLAVSREAVGVDVEWLDPTLDAQALAQLVLSDNELAEFSQRTALEKSAYLLQRWTCKEAFLKARAIGLAVPLGNVTMKEVAPGEFQAVGNGTETTDDPPWRIVSWSPSAACFAAVAYRGTECRLQEQNSARVLEGSAVIESFHGALHNRGG